MEFGYLERNLKEIRGRIRNAERSVGRKENEVRLIAAVKYAEIEEINELCRLGVCDLGENRVQQMLEHYEQLECRDSVRMHFIGSLQTNKVKYIIDKVCMIHSLDSLKLAAEIDRQAKKHGLCMDVLVEINT